MILSVDVRVRPNNSYVSCDGGAKVEFTGTIQVNRTATVTWRWDPPESSTDATTREVAPDRPRTVTRVLTVHGASGQTRSGEMTLAVSAPGADPVSAAAPYSITCL